ncbi:hypothetical protein EDD86DRAFT_204390 [Gorgonomyces haynaldii]|nr:hypothetical protein EDD86DRAFT_204390 [Gorgonomyces haynaldii]
MLDKFILLVGGAAVYNSLQCFIPSMNLTPRIYAREPKQVTPLASRLMGTWTLTSAIIRIYSSFHIHEKAAYDLCWMTFFLAFASFYLEVFVYKTAPLSSKGVWPAMLVSTTGIFWMYFARDHYLATQ